VDFGKIIKTLYGNDNKEAYTILLELEKISETDNILYDYLDEFFQMIQNEKTFIRIRGYRLLCKQAKWDTENKINKMVDKILVEAKDEIAIAVRQKIKALEDIARSKKELNAKIKQAIEKFNFMDYKGSMQNLIYKDIQNLLELIDKQNNISYHCCPV
jgi:hypothetical protein